jgi:hypothetical protein
LAASATRNAIAQMDGDETHLHEQAAERGGVGRGVFDELEAVGAEWIFPEVGGAGDGHGCSVSDGSIRRATAGKRAIVDLVGKRRWQFIVSSL